MPEKTGDRERESTATIIIYTLSLSALSAVGGVSRESRVVTTKDSYSSKSSVGVAAQHRGDMRPDCGSCCVHILYIIVVLFVVLIKHDHRIIKDAFFVAQAQTKTRPHF